MFRRVIVILSLAWSFSVWAESPASLVSIDVDAGDPVSLCPGETLILADLGASISGDVSDGLWFTYGDGIFLPSGTDNGIFSTTTQYQPGPQDIANGGFTLVLVSDDPDGTGPMVEVSDEVVLTFNAAPPLACNNSINVSLSENCEQAVDITMLLANPIQPYDDYTITVYDQNGNPIPGNILTAEQINQEITFVVGHKCTTNTCMGEIIASDYIPPFMTCTDLTIDCDQETIPDSTGFPYPFYAQSTPIGQDSFSIQEWDACGDVILWYSDDFEAQSCQTGSYLGIIHRLWTATDENGNQSTCNQNIHISPMSLDDITMPQNYDGITLPPLSCGGDWVPLSNGYPSPETTGNPAQGSCSNIESTFTDIYFELCGAGFKIWRQWVVIDWCTSETIDFNQIIMVSDSLPPLFECPDTIVLNTQGYFCLSEPYTIIDPAQVDDCSDVDFSYMLATTSGIDITANHIFQNTLSDIPAGEYVLKTIGTDACGNKNECLSTLIVEDDSPPFAICDGYTQVSLNNYGYGDLYAFSLDDGSFDNCGDITMEVAKMTDQCNWGLAFGSKVRFCCEETGDSIQVAFRVTDNMGLSNTCMVTVYVDDKLPPGITCPTDITIDCQTGYNPEMLDVFGTMIQGDDNPQSIIINGEVLGQGGYYQDNCEASLTNQTTIDISCGAGTIQRSFTATDSSGLSASCEQTITIINNNPFTESDITWPQNYNANGCDTLQASPDITGMPIYDDFSVCAMVATTYEDQIFYLAGEACVKILRHWTVIDWCQYDNQNTDALWTYDQVIKLNNSVAPQFENCQDLQLCNQSSNCTAQTYTLEITATDDCTEEQYLQYTWAIDLGNDDIFDGTGNGNMAQIEIPIGTHSMTWTVTDGCGNVASCTQNIEVKDCKNPTPYCQTAITTVVMPSSGSITIWAADYNLGSYDNCTATEDLSISFSQDTSDISRTLTCDDLVNGIAGEIPLEIWVTDQTGNQEKCDVSIILQDNNNVCEDQQSNATIAGKISMENGKTISGIQVMYNCAIETYSDTMMTMDNGIFEVHDIPGNLNYTLRPSYASTPNAGVSTLDIVLTQRHILELAPFDNPYDIIAADVTSDKRISGGDLVIMRKMVLGIIDKWPKDLPNWKFVDSAYEFPEPDYPFDFPDSIIIQNLTDSTYVSFISIKMGDVNESFKPNPFKPNHPTPSPRNEEKITLLVHSGLSLGQTKKSITIEEPVLDGIQMSIALPDDGIFSSDILTQNDYRIDGNLVKISWTNPYRDIIDGPFFEIISSHDFDLNLTDDLTAEGYVDLEAMPIELVDTTPPSRPDHRLIHGKNPFDERLSLHIPDNGHLDIFDLSGKTILSQEVNQGIMEINTSTFASGKVFILKWTGKNARIITEKAIKVP